MKAGFFVFCHPSVTFTDDAQNIWREEIICFADCNSICRMWPESHHYFNAWKDNKLISYYELWVIAQTTQECENRISFFCLQSVTFTNKARDIWLEYTICFANFIHHHFGAISGHNNLTTKHKQIFHSIFFRDHWHLLCIFLLILCIFSFVHHKNLYKIQILQ